MRPLHIPPYPKRLSLLTLLFGIIVFLWLTPEDSVWFVSVLGVVLSLILAAHGIFKWVAGRTFPARIWFPAAVALGAVVGAGAVLMTMLLMLMKTSVHNHLYPDYSIGVMDGILQRIMPWTLAGALAGLAGALFLSARQN